MKRVSRNEGCYAGKDRVCSSGHCTGLFESRFQGPSVLTQDSSLRLPIPLCRLSNDPSSRGIFSPLGCFSEFLHPCLSRVRCAFCLTRSYANHGGMSRYFCRFYFGEHLVAGMRTKGTCSLRKSSRRRQEGGSHTQLGLFTCS